MIVAQLLLGDQLLYVFFIKVLYISFLLFL